MSNRILASAFILVVSLPACGPRPEPVSVPATWKHIDVGPFSFWAPPDLSKAPLPGVPFDSYVGDFQGKGIVLSFDYGLYSSPLQAPGDDLRWHNELIGGRAARMVSYTAAPKGEFPYPNFVAVNFPQTGRAHMRLTMYASCGGMSSCRDSEDIFRTIRFN
jgi:hypothetical protein